MYHPGIAPPPFYFLLFLTMLHNCTGLLDFWQDWSQTLSSEMEVLTTELQNSSRCPLLLQLWPPGCAQLVKNPLATQKTCIPSWVGRSQEKEAAATPVFWPRNYGLWSAGSLIVGHNERLSFFHFHLNNGQRRKADRIPLSVYST